MGQKMASFQMVSTASNQSRKVNLLYLHCISTLVSYNEISLKLKSLNQDEFALELVF